MTRKEAPLWRRYARMFGPNPAADIDDEVKHHVELLVEHFMARGLAPAEARGLALRRFGNVGTVKSNCARIARRRERAMARAELIDRMIQDVRFAARTFARTPAFTLAVLLTLALGIGANTAVFSVVNAVLLRPLPFTEPNGVISVWTRYVPESGSDVEFSAVSVPEYRDYRQATRALSDVAAYSLMGTRANVAGGAGDPDRVAVTRATANIFNVLGVKAAVGRTFAPGEDAVGAPCTIVLSDGFRNERFGTSRDVLNQTLRVDGTVCTIVGVMPAGFFFPRPDVKLWRPFSPDEVPELAEERESHWIAAVGRLAPGATLEHAQAELAPMMRAWRKEFPHHKGHFVIVQPLREDLVGSDRPVLLVLLAGVGLVLLIICANLANLLLARAEGRRREIAVRVALGAGRARLLRQLLTESLLLAGVGGLAALLIGPLLLRLLVSLDDSAVPTIGAIDFDARVLGFTALLSLITGAVFGAIPAFQLSGLRLHDSLKNRASTSTRASLTVRRSLVVIEVALSVAIVIAAGLLVRSYQRLQNVQLGYDPTDVLAMDITLPASEYAEPARVHRFYQQLRDHAAALPGLRSAGLLSDLPLRSSPPDDGYRIEGVPDPQPGEPSIAGGYILATPGSFETLKVPILRGRSFDERDVSGAPLVAIVDETAARLHWKGQDPLGRRIRYYGLDSLSWLTVVGVAGPARYNSLRTDPEPNVYVPHAQTPRRHYPGRDMTLVVRAQRNPNELSAGIRDIVRRLDPVVPITRVASMDEVIARASGRPRFAAGLMGLFGLVALLVGALGVYGVLSYTVQSRTNEIGIRMALGANAGTVRLQVLAQGMVLALIGILAGTGIALLSGGVLSKLLFGIDAQDLPTYTVTMSVLATVALVASWLPARRATRIDPLTALRV
jgi:putative ABC transport system permease protein